MDWKAIWKNQKSTIISAAVAILVIVGLFVVFNALPANQNSNQKEEQKQEQPGEEKKKEDEKAKEPEVKLPTEHPVVAGEHLWDVSIRYYGTGFNWVAIARANDLENPDKVVAGTTLSIPKLQPDPDDRTHTVATGDTLWDLAEQFYGDGFQWQKIANANPGKIGMLPDGSKALITPGTILVIP